MDEPFRRVALAIARRATTTAAMTDEHLTAEIIAAYADGELAGEERVAADEHLARCTPCRRELAAVSDLLASAPQARRRRSWPVLAAGLAAAALAFVFLPRAFMPPPHRATERAVEPNASWIEIVAPVDNGIIGPGGRTTIVWRRVDRSTTYRVTVSDTTGATRLVTETVDTSLVVPDSVRLEAGSRFYLTVDALRSDGWPVRSHLRTFNVAR
jgi:predicted anti-sigma-YlaC factor YlaD